MELISSTLMKTPLERLRAACASDCQQQYTQAVLGYMEGVPLLLDLARDEGLSLQTKQLVKNKCQVYLDRIQVIRAHLDAGDEVPPNAGVDRTRPNMETLDEDSRQFIQSLIYVPFECSMEEVIGAVEVKDFLEKNIIVPLMFPGSLDSVTRVKKGILLYGLPGIGKTFLLSALAAAVSCPFFRVVSSDLIMRWQGVEGAVQRVKDMFTFLCQNQPCILCLDDLDTLCEPDYDTEGSISRTVREELSSQLMNMPADNQVTVIAATQKPWYLGGTLRRRFDRRFYLTLPTEAERVRLCTHELQGTNHQLSQDDLHRIAQMTSGYTGADMSVLVRSFAMAGVRRLQTATHFRKVTLTSGENAGKEMMVPCDPSAPGAVGITFEFLNPERLEVPALTVATVESEVKGSRPSVSDLDLQQMDQWHEQFGQKN